MQVRAFGTVMQQIGVMTSIKLNRMIKRGTTGDDGQYLKNVLHCEKPGRRTGAGNAGYAICMEKKIWKFRRYL